jgi:hypothetical protein
MHRSSRVKCVPGVYVPKERSSAPPPAEISAGGDLSQYVAIALARRAAQFD